MISLFTCSLFYLCISVSLCRRATARAPACFQTQRPSPYRRLSPGQSPPSRASRTPRWTSPRPASTSPGSGRCATAAPSPTLSWRRPRLRLPRTPTLRRCPSSCRIPRPRASPSRSSCPRLSTSEDTTTDLLTRRRARFWRRESFQICI